MRILCHIVVMGLLCPAIVLADDSPILPPLPSDLPAILAPAPESQVRRPRITVPAPQVQRQLSLPNFPAATNRTVNRILPSYTPRTVGDDVLKWDQVNKEYTAQPGEVTALFSFAVTNISEQDVVINWVRPSCGCTLARLPPTPWTLTPGAGGNIDLEVDLRGKYGVLSKYVSVDTSLGQKMLGIRVNIPAASLAAARPGMDSRARNMQLAMVDRQVVFRGECASCHATPAIGQTTGEAIYNSACAICHDAPHRATMVPDLRALQVPTNKEYWSFWITHGKEGSLMPAFAKAKGGPLSDEQIRTLAEYLAENIPSQPASAAKAENSATATVGGAAPDFPTIPTAKN